MKANVAEKNTAEPERALLANRAFFDAVAGGYDYGRAAYFYHDLKRVRHEFDGYIAPHLPVNPLVLDLGCGTGFYSSVLADLGCRRFSCVDLNDAFLKLISIYSSCNLIWPNLSVEQRLFRLLI